jgi:hypothetical protein
MSRSTACIITLIFLIGNSPVDFDKPERKLRTTERGDFMQTSFTYFLVI